MFSGSTEEVQKSLRIKYNLDTKHLTSINSNSLKNWKERFHFNYFETDFTIITKAMKALDLFYSLNWLYRSDRATLFGQNVPL
jgi:hypothetical protein